MRAVFLLVMWFPALPGGGAAGRPGVQVWRACETIFETWEGWLIFDGDCDNFMRVLQPCLLGRIYLYIYKHTRTLR
jgi:hypothetical protein